jgi:ATP-binding cassette subfamily B protein
VASRHAPPTVLRRHAAVRSADPSVLRRGLKILALGIRTQPRPFAVAVIGAALFGGMTVASAVVFGEVTDRVIVPAFATGATTAGALAFAAGALVAVGLVKAVGIVLRRTGATYLQFKLQAIFRRRVTRQYTRLPLAWHRRHTVGTLLSNANADVDAAFWPFAPLPFATGVLLMLAITGALLIATDPFLAAVGFLVGPALGLANWRYNRLIEVPSTQAQEQRAVVSAIAHDSFDGALVVKTLGREAAETERFAHASDTLRDELVHLARIRAVYDPLMEALPSVGVVAILLVGAWRIGAGTLTAGELVQFAYLFTLLAFPVRAIGWVLAELPRAVVGWERVERVLAADSALPDGDAQLDAAAPADVDVVDVAFSYDHEPTLRGVTFRAPPGRTIAVVGPTGAGKSTIASLLVRLADPDGGAVHLDGRDLRSVHSGALARHAAIVFQHSFLFDDTVRENITLGEPFTDDDVRAAARLAQADAFIGALPQGYDTVVGERGASLSGGQRQRVALARALVRRPRLLLLDDATSSVDPAVEAAILRGLRDAALPSTLVVVAYRRATIALADEIVFVTGGRVTARGTHDELFAAVPAYARLVTAYDQTGGPGTPGTPPREATA